MTDATSEAMRQPGEHPQTWMRPLPKLRGPNIGPSPPCPNAGGRRGGSTSSSKTAGWGEMDEGSSGGV
jgi:hypothetical protein